MVFHFYLARNTSYIGMEREPSPHPYSKGASLTPGHAVLGHFDQHYQGAELVPVMLFLYSTHAYSTGLS